ncbi:MAG TPA: heliorhodopsin HeR [Candidatus Saccharimonadales bacterium]|nr:heliorhodopsin HeR [Candidatus Saccharimonadales bacterium]
MDLTTAPMAPEQSRTMRRLRTYNLLMGLLHLAQGIAVVILSNNFFITVTTNFLKFNVYTQTLETMTRTVFDLRFGYWVAAFFFLSALFHFVIGTFYYKTYANNLTLHVNKARWIEYSLSASLMIILIGALSGIYDASTLLLMFGLTAVMNLCGLVMEKQNRDAENPDMTAFWVGSLAGILPWLAILIYFLGAASETNNAIPTFVYWIYVSIFIFFNAFAVNMYLQYKRLGPWHDYLFGERMYILLSLIAKSLLAWQIFAGTLRPM